MGDNKMDEDSKVSYDTANVPTVYCNIANVTVSFNDLRLYLAEMGPSAIAVNPDATIPSLDKSKASVSPKLSIVMNPEFAKSVADAILGAVAKYEEIFGPLRTPKTLEQVAAALQQSPTKK
jgi:uncharacterized protein DUF3467